MSDECVPSETSAWLASGEKNIILIYLMYMVGVIADVVSIYALASAFIAPISILGLIIAYINRGKADGWVQTHYVWAIRTFWLAVTYSIISIILTIIAVGHLLMFVVVIWSLIRVLTGLWKIMQDEPINKPESWLF